MELNTFRTVVEVIVFTAYVAIVLWAYSARRRADFDNAASIPFDHE